MRATVKVILVLCVLAFVGGMERARDARPTRPVAVSRIAGWWCEGDRGVQSVAEDQNSVFHATCRDGVVVRAVGR